MQAVELNIERQTGIKTDTLIQTTDKALISVDSVSIRFGGVAALSEVSFQIQPGEILGLIGPNGAGKTTLFNCLTRLYTPTAGDILVDGRSILGHGPDRLAQLGISRTFQNLALFGGQSVMDNVCVGAHTRVHGSGVVMTIGDVLHLPSARRREQEVKAIAGQLIDRLGLSAYANRAVGELSFGLQKRVELARALAVQPRLLLLDEPAGGLNHGDVDELGVLIRELQAELGLAVLLVEHHMGLVMSLAQRVVALNFGRKIAEGVPAQIQAHPEVIAAYLGSHQEVAA